MVDISNGVLFIGLLSVLSLAAADEFSDGTADYVVVGWVEERTLEDTMREEAVEYSSRFKVEIFAIKEETAKCLYKVLRVSSSSFWKESQFIPGHLVKASCSVSLATLSTVVRYNYDEVNYKLKGNIRHTFPLPIKDHYKESEWPAYPTLPESAGLDPFTEEEESQYPEQWHYDRRGNILWDGMFYFSVKSVNHDNKCTRSWLGLSYATGGWMYNFSKDRHFWCSCGEDRLSIHRFIKKIDPDMLVFKLKDGTCLQTKAKYDPKAKRVIEAEPDKTVDCDEFFNRTVPAQ